MANSTNQNSTMKYTNIYTNSTTQPITSRSATYQSQAITIVQVTLLAILGVIIVLGNLASIVTFLKTQSLRRRCYYLIISLAFADFFVGVDVFMVMCYFLAPPMSDHTFIVFAVSLEFVDVASSYASILTLAAIALERFLAIYVPFRHRMLSFKFYIICIALPWLLAFIFSSFSLTPRFLDHSAFYTTHYYNLSIFALIALIFITFSYVFICLKIMKNNTVAQHQNRASRERKLAVTLLIVTLSSLLTWLPHQCFLFIVFIFHVYIVPYAKVLFAMLFLKFVNSGINVFIYIARMSEFRQAFLALFNNNVWQRRTEGESFQTSVRDGSINSDRVCNDIPRNDNYDSATALERIEVDIIQNTELNYGAGSENNDTNPIQIKELIFDEISEINKNSQVKQHKLQKNIESRYSKNEGVSKIGVSDIKETKF